MNRILFSLMIGLFALVGCRTVLVPPYQPTDSNLRFSTVRVFLAEAKEEEIFKSETALEVFDANDLMIKKAFGFVSVNPLSLKAPIRLISADGIVEYKGTKYRGEIQLKPENGKVYVLNLVELESYLISVVPSEMPASWPQEALKAQAVCARTYVLREMIGRKNKAWDVDTSTNTQVYKGVAKENPKSTAAVEETSGLILVFNGTPIQSFFHSNSGGVTEDPKNVWGNSVDYLTSIRSDYDKVGDNYAWEEKIKISQMDYLLSPLGIGQIQDILVVNRFPSARVEAVEVQGSNGTKQIKGVEFRKLMGATKLRSTRFGIRKEDETTFYIKGLGSGHGVGLSQWGSYGMAKENKNFTEILSYYYKGVDFARVQTN